MTAVASHTKAQVSAGTAAPAGRARFALGTRVLLALTRDPGLIATLRQVADPAHEVCVAGSEVDLGTVLVAQHGGVVVLDTAALATPVAELALRLLKQFPDVVLIVAGSAGEQGSVAALITDGSVHRFLHKPVSEQRVRAFVESAWRRHAEGGTGAAASSAPEGTTRRRLSWALWVTGVLASLAAASAWYLMRTPPPLHAPPPPAAAPRAAASAAGDPLLESLLARADQAFARGELVAPPGKNAAELYREALRRNARDTRAANGLEQVIDRLVSEAEALLGARRVDEAQRLADAAHAISPDHPRVAFLRAQIGTQRERALMDRAQRAAAAGNVAGAIAVLDDAAHGGRSSTLVNEARVQLAQKQLDARVAGFLERGRSALEHGQLIEPPEQNARFFFESARALAPGDESVQQAASDLITRLKEESSRALAAGNADQAERWAAAAADAGADPVEAAQLRSAAQGLRGARAASFQRSVQLFNQRLTAGRIVEPAGDSAKFYLAQLTQADADHPSTQLARSNYDTRLLDETRGALKARDLAAARAWLTEARAAGADSAAVAALDADLGAAEQQASTYVSASTLTRTHYVAAQFPPAALARGTDGWVDLEFTVGLDGAVGELLVLGAQPAGVFEQAALDAVRHWRYQPVKRGGEAVIQRARVRVRFVLQR